jgi:uncharacterized membrane protein
MTGLTVTMVVLAALSFVNAGAFLAFTTMVTPALATTHDTRAAADVMRDMNVRAPRSIFMVSFLGAPLAAIVAGVLLVITGFAGPAWWTIGSIAATLVAFVVSVAVNIPWNERLVRDHGDATWGAFSRAWAPANTARCLLSIAAGAAALAAVM